jgi:hypothetical protein
LKIGNDFVDKNITMPVEVINNVPGGLFVPFISMDFRTIKLMSGIDGIGMIHFHV